VANYYKMGPATTKTIILEATLEGPHPGTQSYYVSGNIRENRNGTKTYDKENDTYKKEVKAIHSQQWEVFVDQPFFPSYATIETAEQAYRSVLCDVGCNQPELDNHDQRMVNETLNGTTTTVGRNSQKKGLIDHEDDAEGFAGLNIIEAAWPRGWDTDQDGMPDWYEQLAQTDPNTADHNEDIDQNGYTNLEDYLECMAHPHFVMNAEEERVIDLRPYFAGLTDFTVIDDSLRASDGFIYSYEGQQLKVQDVFGGRVMKLHVMVKDSQSDCTLGRSFYFFTINDFTGIAKPAAAAQPSPLYNLQGQRLSSAAKGINIRDGKKFVSY